MKKTILILTMMVAAAIVYAAPSSERPESSVPTPAERSEISREMPDLGDQERADWQKLRAERRAAREQILMDLRNSSSAEKKNMRREFSKNREEMPRFDGNFPKNESREGRPFYERSDSRPMNPKWEDDSRGAPPFGGERPYGEPPPFDGGRGNH